MAEVVGVTKSDNDGEVVHDSVVTSPSEFMLTTTDNPHSPFDEFDDWHRVDQRLGYNTLTLLARVAYTSSDLSDADQQLAIDQAIDDILENNISENYRKVTRKDFDN